MMKNGLIAGVLGALILIAMMYAMQAANLAGEPGFVGIGKIVMGAAMPPVALNILSAFGFALAGGLWGLLFASLVKIPTILKGMLFGLAPTFFLWLVIAPLMGKPLFNGFELKGILFPLLFNVVIWGGFVGWFLSRRS